MRLTPRLRRPLVKESLAQFYRLRSNVHPSILMPQNFGRKLCLFFYVNLNHQSPRSLFVTYEKRIAENIYKQRQLRRQRRLDDKGYI